MQNNGDLKTRSISGFIWKLFEKAGSQIVSMVVQIVLARLLLPDDYGIIGYMTLFIAVSDVFLKQGFTTALIQKKQLDDIDCSTVFYANICMSICIYFLFFSIAPYVAIFYDEPRLLEVMRVLSLTIVIGAFSAVHEALLAKQLDFKKTFYRTLANTIVYGAVGIILAFLGFGVWSLVIGRLSGAIIGAIVLILTVKWKPKKSFSFRRLKELFSFSSGVLFTNLLETVFHNISSLIIGRYYESADLGYYQRGQNIPQTIMGAIDGSMTEVMYPTLSELQDNIERLKNALRRSMKLSMFICMPVLMGLLVTAEPLTIILLTEKWLPSVPYMQLTCVITMFWPLAARLHALKALGKSSLTFRISLITNAFYLVVLLAIAKLGPIFIMAALVIANVFSLFFASYFINKYIKYSLWELIQDICPAVLLSLIMGVAVYSITFLNLNPIVTLSIQVLLGMAIYVLGCIVTHNESFNYLLSLIKQRK